MERLYLDNFRGFSKQLIEIRNVNFLVGENSTGKSSVLMALNTLSYPGFWLNLDFHSGDETQLYSFEDLVSVEAKDKTSFRIGKLYNNEEEVSFLFEFKNFFGRPAIASGIIEKDENLFIYYLEKEQVKYKVIRNQKLSLDMLEALTENELNELETISIYTTNIPPVILLQMCEHAISNKKEAFPSRFPTFDITPIAPIRSKPKKTYDEPGIVENSEGDHIPYEIRRIFKEYPNFFQNINNFGIRSGMFKKIDIKEYGKTDDAPFRMNFVLNKKPINISNIGYGVSQVLPILYNIYTKNNTNITIQQPEVHLHPRAQAALGDIFFDLSKGKSKNRLIVETHSDYIIDRFRQKQRKSPVKSDVHVLFFLREKGENKIFTINIDDNGNYDENQPKEFREFFINEGLENLGLYV